MGLSIKLQLIHTIQGTLIMLSPDIIKVTLPNQVLEIVVIILWQLLHTTILDIPEPAQLSLPQNLVILVLNHLHVSHFLLLIKHHPSVSLIDFLGPSHLGLVPLVKIIDLLAVGRPLVNVPHVIAATIYFLHYLWVVAATPTLMLRLFYQKITQIFRALVSKGMRFYWIHRYEGLVAHLIFICYKNRVELFVIKFILKNKK